MLAFIPALKDRVSLLAFYKNSLPEVRPDRNRQENNPLENQPGGIETIFAENATGESIR